MFLLIQYEADILVTCLWMNCVMDLLHKARNVSRQIVLLLPASAELPAILGKIACLTRGKLEAFRLSPSINLYSF